MIELEEVHRIYPGDVPVHAVRGVSLRINRGEYVAIMGASGSGKSSLMNLLGCLDRPTRGSYRLDGTEVSTLSKDELAGVRNRKLGFVFQGFNLLARTTALENVELPMLCGGVRIPARDVRARAVEALERVGLGGRLGHFPSQLSGGQQQRVAIARALVNRPGVILADEPTGNLDTRTSVDVMALFQELNDAGITIVMVTHEPDIARYCRRNLVMRDGLVVRDEPVEPRLLAADDARLENSDEGPGTFEGPRDERTGGPRDRDRGRETRDTGASGSDLRPKTLNPKPRSPTCL